MRYDGCHIIVFQQGLGPVGDAWMKSLKAKATRVKILVGQNVVILEDKDEKDGWKLFVARPKANIVLLGTDQDYLEKVLQRMQTKPKDRALPDDLPEWKHVDKQAPFWAVRHFDTTAKGRDVTVTSMPVIKPVGVAFTFNPAKDNILRLVFLSANTDARKEILTWPVGDEGLKVKVQQSGPGVLEVEVNMEDRKNRSMIDVLGAFGHVIII